MNVHLAFRQFIIFSLGMILGYMLTVIYRTSAAELEIFGWSFFMLGVLLVPIIFLLGANVFNILEHPKGGKKGIGKGLRVDKQMFLCWGLLMLVLCVQVYSIDSMLR